MKIAIPTNIGGMEDIIFAHFGRAPTYTLHDTKTGETKVVLNGGEHICGMGKAPTALSKFGADAIICAGMGPRAIQVLKQLGIRVYYSNAQLRVGEIVELFKDGKLPEMDERQACQDHGDGHAHGHGCHNH